MSMDNAPGDPLNPFILLSSGVSGTMILSSLSGQVLGPQRTCRSLVGTRTTHARQAHHQSRWRGSSLAKLYSKYGHVCYATEKEGNRDMESKRAGRATYRPSTFTELIDDAVGSIVYGIQDGLNRVEVEFPAVSDVDGYKGSSDLYIDANIQLAIAAARKIFSTTAMKVHLLLPDEPEYRRAYKLCVDWVVFGVCICCLGSWCVLLCCCKD